MLNTVIGEMQSQIMLYTDESTGFLCKIKDA